MLSGGFADPVHDAQAAFRAILDALAQPGTINDLPRTQAADSSLDLASVLLTLVDHDTPIWLADCYRSSEISAFVGFHTGAPIVADPWQSQFAFARTSTLPSLDQFNPGTQEYPDRSTTLVLALPSLDGGAQLVMRGPGIDGERTVSPQGLPEAFIAQWQDNRALFPRGIDLLLVAGGQVLGLPRTVRIEKGH